MYCRKCGAKINDNAKFCDTCGEQVVVVKQRSDSQKFHEIQELEKAKKDKNKSKKDLKREKKYESLKNPYVYPAIGSAAVAFALAIFPWPRDWGIGTALWMRILILVLALLANYHCTKARQVNNLFYNQYRYKVQPKLVTVATWLAIPTTIAALFALFMM